MLSYFDRHKGNAKKGCGWKDANYNFYCEQCNLEIQKPFIFKNDTKKINRCVECKQSNELFTRETRIAHLNINLDLLLEEEQNMLSRKKRWRLFRHAK